MIWVKYSGETSLLGEYDLQVGRKMSGFEQDVMKLSETRRSRPDFEANCTTIEGLPQSCSLIRGLFQYQGDIPDVDKLRASWSSWRNRCS